MRCLVFFTISATALAKTVLVLLPPSPEIPIFIQTPPPVPTPSPPPVPQNQNWISPPQKATPPGLSIFKDQEGRFTFPSLSLPTRLWNNSLSASDNFRSAKDLSKRFLLDTARKTIPFLRSLDYATLGNIAFRATVRSLTPGHGLHLRNAFFRVSSDIAIVKFARQSFPLLSSPPSDNDNSFSLALSNITLLDLWLPDRVHSLEDLEYETRQALALLPSLSQVNRWLKTALAHMDTSALVSMGLHTVANWFGLPVDTTYTIAVMDDLMHLVFQDQDHRSAFYKFREVLRSIDGLLPGLNMSSLTLGLPHGDTIESPGQDIPVNCFVPSSSPLSGSSDEKVIDSTPECIQAHHEEPPSRRPEALSGYVIPEEDYSSILRDIVSAFISFLAGCGVAVTVGKRFIAHRNAGLARKHVDDAIKFHILRSLSYLPWEHRMKLVETLSRMKGPQQILPPRYSIVIASNMSEKQITMHVTKLMCALTPTRRRVLVQVLAIASPFPTPPNIESSTAPEPSPPIPPAPDPPDSEAILAASLSTSSTFPIPPLPALSVATTPPS